MCNYQVSDSERDGSMDVYIIRGTWQTHNDAELGPRSWHALDIEIKRTSDVDREVADANCEAFERG